MNTQQVLLVFAIGTVISTLFVSALIIFLIHYKRKQQMHITEKLQLQHQYEHQLLLSRLEVQEQSFQYFSEEIHDNVGAVLTVCKMHLHQLAQLYHNSEAEELISESSEMLTKALTDLRSISHTLNGNFIARAGLKEALEKELKYITSVRGMKVNLETKGEVFDMPQEKELMIFRIIQEAIANALKHASATVIRVRLEYQPDLFKVVVADNGTGFDTTNIKYQGLGLSNMQTRAALLGGNIHFDSRTGGGTTVSLQVNMHHERTDYTYSHS